MSLTESAAWQLIMQTDIVSKCILASLFFLSVTCIAIIIHKLIELRKELRLLKKINQYMLHINSLKECEKLPATYPGVGKKLIQVSLETHQQIAGGNTILTDKEKDLLDLKIGQQVQQLTLSLEHNLPTLGISSAVAPLVGLFGTVWGLVHAFIDISIEKTADIATVAPGIAEALMTTLAGLIVAIPAMIAFHYCAHQIRLMESLMNQIGDTLVSLSDTHITHKEKPCLDVIGSSRANS